ncbi:MAG: flavodoxin family protein [Armatimonadota bacterium]
MKVVGFVGSPRIGGNAETLLKQVFTGCEKAGASEVNFFNLNMMHIKGCQACYYCREHEACAIKDDMQKIYSDIKDADAVVIGSPIYMFQMSAQTKLMVDRFLAFLGPDFKTRLGGGKDTILVFTQGQPDVNTFKPYIDHTVKMYEFLGFRVKDVIIGGGLMEKEDAGKNTELMKKAEEAGSRLIKNLAAASKS